MIFLYEVYLQSAYKCRVKEGYKEDYKKIIKISIC